MKQTIRIIIALTAFILCGTMVWAEDWQKIRLVTNGSGEVTMIASGHAVNMASLADTTFYKGSVIALTVKPNDGYYIEDLSVSKTVKLPDGNSSRRRASETIGAGDIALTLSSGTGNLHEQNTYTFNMPTEDYSGVNINVKFSARENVTDVAATVSVAEATYSGVAQTPDVTVTIGDKTLTKNRDYTVTYSGDNVNVIEATADDAPTATVTFIGAYTRAENIVTKFGIGKALLTVTADDKTVEYGGEAPAYTVSYDGFVNNETDAVLAGELAFACDYPTSSAVGKYDIMPSGQTSSNYDITFVPGTLTVNKPTLTVTADNKTISYGDQIPEFTVTYSGFINDDDASKLGGFPSFTSDYTMSSPVGSYTITPSGLTSQEYNIVFQTGTLTVTAKQIENVSGTTVTLDEDGYHATISDGTQAAGVVVDEVTTASLEYSRTLSGSGNKVEVDGEQVRLYTVCLPYAPPTEGVKYYTLSGANSEVLSFREIAGTPQAYTPYVAAVTGNTTLSCENATVDFGHSISSGGTAGGYELCGTLRGLSNEDAAAVGAFVLQEGGRWQPVETSNTAAYIPPFRAYIVSTGSQARQLTSTFGTTTGMTLRTIDQDGTERWYDLQGRRIDTPTRHGTFIHNGKVVRR